LDESAARFVAKMREAAFADLDHKVNRQAALAKVRMLESVKTQLNKYGLDLGFVYEDITAGQIPDIDKVASANGTHTHFSSFLGPIYTTPFWTMESWRL